MKLRFTSTFLLASQPGKTQHNHFMANNIIYCGRIYFKIHTQRFGML